MADEKTEFINVVFDPTFTSFEQDLATMSLDKMMSIQYSEEILQKNFTVMINILKQLHKGLVLMGGQVKDNNDWVMKLREVSQSSESKEKVVEEKLGNFATKEEVQGMKSIFNNILKDQEVQIQEIVQEQKNHKDRLNGQDDKQKSTDSEIERLNAEIAALKSAIDGINTKLDQQPKEVEKIVIKEAVAIESQPSQMDPEQLRAIIDKISRAEFRIDEIQHRLDSQGEPSVQQIQQEVVSLDEVNRRLLSHDEDIAKLFDLLEEMKKRPVAVEQVGDDREVQGLKTDVKKIFLTIEQMQTQLNLMGTMSGGEGADISENQVALLLAEINKLRQLLHDFVTQGDLQNEVQKQNAKTKQVNDRIDEEIEKVRREFKGKFDKKAETVDLQKLIAEINALRDLNKLVKRGSQASIIETTTPQKAATIDPDFLIQFKDLQEQVNQIEHESLNLKTNFTQFNHQMQQKIHEIEKRLQGFQTDKIFFELQNLREMCDQLKKDSDGQKAKIKEFKSKIDQIMTREDIMALLDSKLKALRDEIIKMLDELKTKLDRKADIEDLQKVESNFLAKLEEVVQALIKQLANKSETKKALIYLEQKINQIFMILDGDGGTKDADGLFAKKPLLWSCASCDKELDKFKGQLGDYKGWAVFPPKETSPERMGRFGVGYKSMQDRQKQNRDKLEKKEEPMSQSQTNLPKIKQ